MCFTNALGNIVLSFTVGTVLVVCSSSTSCFSIQEVNGPSNAGLRLESLLLVLLDGVILVIELETEVIN